MKDIEFSMAIPKVAVYLLIAIQISLLIGKLTYVSDWSWLVILLPLFTVIIGFVICYYLAMTQDKHERDDEE